MSINETQRKSNRVGSAAAFAQRHPSSLVWVLAFLFGFLITSQWFTPGAFVAQGDVPPFFRDGQAGQIGWLWNHIQTGAGAPTTGIGQFAEFVFLDGARFLGLSDPTAQWLMFGIVCGLASGGSAYFARVLGLRAAPSFFVGVVGVVNPITLTSLPNILPILALGVMATLGGLLLEAARPDGRGRPFVFAFVSLTSSYVAQNLPLVAIVLLWLAFCLLTAVVLWGRPALHRAVRLLLVGGSLAVLFNLWWIVPNVQTLLSSGTGTSFSAVTEVSDWAWTHQRASIDNVASLTGVWAWPIRESFPWAAGMDSGIFAIIRYALPLAALAAPFVVRPSYRRLAYWLSLTAVTLIFLSKGLHEPFGSINLWMYQHVPAFFLFREPISKFGPMLVLTFAVLAALTVQELWDRRPVRSSFRQDRSLRAVGAAILVLSILAFPYPAWTGSVVPESRPGLPSSHVVIPDDLYAMGSYLDNGAPGKVLSLPRQDFYQMPTTWGFYGVDATLRNLTSRPVITELPGGYYGETTAFSELVSTVEDALEKNDPDRARIALEKLGVSQVVLRQDYDKVDFPERTFKSPVLYAAALNDLDNAPRRFSTADVYEVTPSDDTIISVEADDRPPTVSWEKENEQNYRIQVSGPSSFSVVFRDSYSSGWALRGLPAGAAAEHRQIDGYANAWDVRGVDNGANLTLSYEPGRISRFAISLSLASMGIALVVLLLRLRVHVRKQRNDRTVS